MLGDTCKHDKGFTCFKWGGCPYEGLLPCLKVSVLAQARELERLKHRQMQKHTAVSTKWRNETLYLRKKTKKLEYYIISKGIEVPSTSDLRKLKGGKDERIRSNDTKKEVGKGTALQTDEGGVEGGGVGESTV